MNEFLAETTGRPVDIIAVDERGYARLSPERAAQINRIEVMLAAILENGTEGQRRAWARMEATMPDVLTPAGVEANGWH